MCTSFPKGNSVRRYPLSPLRMCALVPCAACRHCRRTGWLCHPSHPMLTGLGTPFPAAGMAGASGSNRQLLSPCADLSRLQLAKSQGCSQVPFQTLVASPSAVLVEEGERQDSLFVWGKLLPNATAATPDCCSFFAASPPHPRKPKPTKLSASRSLHHCLLPVPVGAGV